MLNLPVSTTITNSRKRADSIQSDIHQDRFQCKIMKKQLLGGKISIGSNYPSFEEKMNCPRFVIPEQQRISIHEWIDQIKDSKIILDLAKSILTLKTSRFFKSKMSKLLGSTMIEFVDLDAGIMESIASFLRNLDTCSLRQKIDTEDSNLLHIKKNIHSWVNNLMLDDLDAVYSQYLPQFCALSNVHEEICGLSARLWSGIFTFLGFEEVISTKRKISKFFFYLSQSDEFLRSISTCKISIDRFWDKYSDPCILLGSHYSIMSARITSLNLSNVNCIDDGSLYLLSQNIKNLASLTISRCQNVSSVGLSFLFQNSCNHLRRLSLNSVSISSDDLIKLMRSCCQSIESIRLQRCDLLDDSFLESLGILCHQNLQEFEVTQCNGFTSDGFASLFSHRLENLSSLTLNNCSLSSNNLRQFSTASGGNSLSELKLSDCSILDDSGFISFLDSFPDLKLLDLSFNLTLSSRVFELAHASSGMNNLEHLSLYGCANLNDHSVRILSSKAILNNLEELILSYTSITDFSLEIISQSSRSLKLLCLDSCRQISNSGIFSIRTLHHLEKFSCSHCPNIDIDGVLSLVSSSRHLSCLDISDCPLIINSPDFYSFTSFASRKQIRIVN